MPGAGEGHRHQLGCKSRLPGPSRNLARVCTRTHIFTRMNGPAATCTGRRLSPWQPQAPATSTRHTSPALCHTRLPSFSRARACLPAGPGMTSKAQATASGPSWRQVHSRKPQPCPAWACPGHTTPQKGPTMATAAGTSVHPQGQPGLPGADSHSERKPRTCRPRPRDRGVPEPRHLLKAVGTARLRAEAQSPGPEHCRTSPGEGAEVVPDPPVPPPSL